MTEITGQVTIDRADLDQLLAVATLYIGAFREDETMTLPERMRLQMVEDVVEKLGKRYWPGIMLPG